MFPKIRIKKYLPAKKGGEGRDVVCSISGNGVGRSAMKASALCIALYTCSLGTFSVSIHVLYVIYSVHVPVRVQTI